MLAPDKDAHFRSDFDVGETMVSRSGISKRGKLSRPSDFATAVELVGLVFTELNPTAIHRQRDEHYA